jgi:hypothetical protein
VDPLFPENRPVKTREEMGLYSASLQRSKVKNLSTSALVIISTRIKSTYPNIETRNLSLNRQTYKWTSLKNSASFLIGEDTKKIQEFQ